MLQSLRYYFIYVILLNAVSKAKPSPPHCTRVTKGTDCLSHYRFDYPVSYLYPGQREGYQQLYCVKPSAVNKAVSVVCDWAAAPRVEFTLGDDYLHVVRQDPTGQFNGNAVITTYQFCDHNIPHHFLTHSAAIPPLAT